MALTVNTTTSMITINAMRHTAIHDPLDYFDKRVAVIGVGTIGSWLAHLLARMQVPFTLYDHDTVEQHNLATQTYSAADIGRTKVEAVMEQIDAIAPGQPHLHVPELFSITDATAAYDIIVSAVDSLDARRSIAQMLIGAGITAPVVDGRVGREQVEVYYFATAQDWLAQLPEGGDTDPCGAKFTAYAAVQAAGLMANNVKRVLLGQPIHAGRVIFDNASMTFISVK
jgi:molybdopterin/thiamine biosynthesis adenylyltransferase